MKVLSYNVNGIRSALSKGLADYLAFADADVVCLQETKAESGQVDLGSLEALGYRSYWFSAAKKGYSGVAILSRMEPHFVDYGCGEPEWDREGRVIRADFKECSVMSVYFPSGSSGDHRQEAKYRFLDFFMPYAKRIEQERPSLLICGDYNICHRAIDIHDPKGNKDSSGFLPEERAWMDAHQYSWWSFRANARNNNKGWRIYYIAASEALAPKLKDAGITQEARHSDHCPVWVEW